MHSLRIMLANRLPFLGRYRRWLRAFVDSISVVRLSYSQHGEDIYVADVLAQYDVAHSIFVDIGANHPTSLSNTYLLYRHGISGVVIEPNKELLSLHERFRRRDTALGIGVGKEARLGRFQVYTAPVLSRFAPADSMLSELQRGVRIWRTEYVPILPLDCVLNAMPHDWICFLSVDTEGLDYDVLLGARETLRKTLVVCVEVDQLESEAPLIRLLEECGFSAGERFGCNLVAVNCSPELRRFSLSRDY